MQQEFQAELRGHFASPGEMEAGEPELCHALEQAALYPNGRVDLSAREMRDVLQHVPASLMRALANVFQAAGQPLRHLILPDQMPALPAFVHELAGLTRLDLHDFRGPVIDLGSIATLEMLDLGRVQKSAQTAVRVPATCRLNAVLADNRPARTWTWPAQHNIRTLLIRPRGLNLNGVAQFPNTQQMIVCRNISRQMLAIWRAEDAQGIRPEAGKTAFDTVVDAREMAFRVPATTEEDYLEAWSKASAVHLIAHEKWNDFLRERFDGMDLIGETRLYMLFESENHVMALRMGIDPSTDERFVDFFDPNFTDEVVQQRQRFSFSAMFGKSKGNSVFPIYFGTARTVRLTEIPDPLQPRSGITSKPEARAISTVHADLPQTWHPSVVRDMLVSGDVRGIEQLSAHLKASPELTGAQCRALLFGNKIIPMHHAAQFGHAGVIAAFGECLKAAFERNFLTGVEIVQILEARGEMQMPALGAAGTRGRPEVFEAYGELLRLLHECKAITPEQASRIMHPKKIGASLVPLFRNRDVLQAMRAVVRKLAKKGALAELAAENLLETIDEARRDLKDRAKPH